MNVCETKHQPALRPSDASNSCFTQTVQSRSVVPLLCVTIGMNVTEAFWGGTRFFPCRCKLARVQDPAHAGPHADLDPCDWLILVIG